MRILATLALAAVACGLAGCGASESGPTPEALDASVALVESCEPMAMLRINEGIIASADELAAHCQALSRRTGGPPPVGLLREFARVAYLISLTERQAGRAVSPQGVGATLAAIMAVRGQTEPAAMRGTLDVVRGMYFGTEGEVRPENVLGLIEAAGPMAQTLSDEGIANLTGSIRREVREEEPDVRSADRRAQLPR